MTFLDDFDGLDENSDERIRPEFKNLIERGNVTVAELEELRCNSWEWEALVPALNDEAFVVQMQRALDNCFTTRQRPFSTYNAAVEGLYAPELIRRFLAKRAACQACSVEAEIGTEENPHPIPKRFHVCSSGLCEQCGDSFALLCKNGAVLCYDCMAKDQAARPDDETGAQE